MTWRTGVLAGLAILACGQQPLAAQRRPTDRLPEIDVVSPPRGYVSFGLVVADAVGDFDDVIDQGFGLGADVSLPVTPDGALSLRGGLGFVVYGHERTRVCFSATVGCRILLDLTTTNNILFGEIGPELAATSGTLRPYINAGLGFSYFATTSSLSGAAEWDAFGDTRNFDDFVGSVGAGGGFRTLIKGGRKPLFLDVGVRYQHNGQAEYLREGDIVDNPDGSITLHPRRSEANLVQYRIGLSIGIPRGKDDRWGRDRRRR